MRCLAILVAAGAAGFVLLISAAMAAYPGGTWVDREASGHSWLGNFLCDLLARQAVAGGSNRVSARLGLGAVLCLSLGLGSLWMLVSRLEQQRPGLRLALRVVGLSSVLAILVLPHATSERCGSCHAWAVALAGVLGLAALLLALVVLGSDRQVPRGLVALGGTVGAGVVLGLCLYAHHVWSGRPYYSLLPGLEKLVALLVVGWMVVLARTGWRLGR